MRPTKGTLLAALAVLAAAVGWGLSALWETVTGRYLPVPWTTGAALALLAAALLIWTLLVRPRLKHHDGARPLEAIVAARTAALAMAASRTGAIAGGVYLGIGLSFVSRFAQESGRDRVVSCAFSVVASVAVVVVALWLERLCRVPEAPDDPGLGTGGSVPG